MLKLQEKLAVVEKPPHFPLATAGFKTPVGVWTIGSLHVLPIWIYAMGQHLRMMRSKDDDGQHVDNPETRCCAFTFLLLRRQWMDRCCWRMPDCTF